jgi:hypothetical protein
METKNAKTALAKAEKQAEVKIMKLGLNLEQTLELVTKLNKKAQQRNRLMAYIEKLRNFEIEQKEETLEGSRFYNGCILVLKDDKGESFEMKNPVIISEVVKFLNQKFEEKAAEIEVEIVLP